MNDNITTESLESKSTLSPRKHLINIQNKISSSPYSYLFFCFAIPVAIMYLIYITMEIYPFGDGSVLVLDLNGQYVSFYETLRTLIYEGGSFTYTFLRGLGGEFIGIYAYYIASPLSYIVALFPQDMMLDALLIIILIKTGLCGLTFGFYLHKNSKHPSKPVIIALSVIYALSAYAVIYQSNIMWIDSIMWLPIITYGIEQLIKYRRYKIFVISLSMSIMSNFYIGYMTCIFVALYYFFYLIAHSKETVNPLKEKLHYLRSFVRIAFFSLLAVAISAFIIIGAYYALSFGKNEFSNPNWSFKTKFEFLDFFTKFLPGTYDTVRPEGLPLVYCGILSLILVPVYFVSKRIETREKLASFGFIAVFVLSFIIRPLDLIWHGFQAPNWMNYRYSFMLCFFLLVLAYKGFGNLKSVGEKFVLGASAFVILLATVCDKLEFSSYVESNSSLLELETIWLTIFASIACFIFLCLIIRSKNVKTRENLAAILAVIVCVEIFCSGATCVKQHRADVGGYTTSQATYSFYNNFIGDLRPIVNAIKESDNGFYRTEKMVHKKKNDNMAIGIKGISNSTSTLNASTIAFLNKMGYVATSNYSYYYGGNPVNDSILGVKYIIDTNDSKKLVNSYQPYTTSGKYTAYYNPYALSLAFGVNSSITEFDMELHSNKYERYCQRLNELVKAMCGDTELEDVFVPISRNDVSSSVSHSCKEYASGSTVTYTKLDSGSAYVDFKFTAPSSAEYYFHSPAYNRTEVNMEVIRTIKAEGIEGIEETEETKTSLGIYLSNDKKFLVPLGYFNEGEDITVRLTMRTDELILYRNLDYIWYIDGNAFDTAFTKLLNNPQLNISEYKDDHIYGTLSTTTSNQMMQTTIPYDEGWKIYVDGTEVEKVETLDALIAFNVEAPGDHQIELKYSPKEYTVGAIISISGIVIFILLCILDIIFYFTIIKKKKPHLYQKSEAEWFLEDFAQDHEESIALVLTEKLTVKETLERIVSKAKGILNFNSNNSDHSSEKTQNSDGNGASEENNDQDRTNEGDN